jgi:hypothetical protein
MEGIFDRIGGLLLARICGRQPNWQQQGKLFSLDK